MRFGGLAAGLEFRLTGAVVEHEILHEPARLDVGQNTLHFSFRFVGNDSRTGNNAAIFGGIADRIAHIGDTAFIKQIDDQLGFVKAFEIGHFRRVARLDQRFETGPESDG